MPAAKQRFKGVLVAQAKKVLVTSALPYANGDIHIGHLVEYLQTDIWVRFRKMRGDECIYVCADDTHGTPVMIQSRKLGIKPETLIARSREQHIKDFAAFNIHFDNYYTTNSPENREISSNIFKNMEEQGHVTVKEISQTYCPHDRMFLPDRFVKGICPNCGAPDQYGDSCDKCSAAYATADLKEPYCTLCGRKPVTRASEHIFFKLENFKDFLKKWVKDHTPQQTANKLQEWLQGKLKDWDISRDAPYFGFEIPGHPGKYFYVWLDAPVGYIASTANWCKKNNRSLAEFWQDKESELYHFIGKDIVYFHTLFWPAMLKTGGFKTPDRIFIHGFLTVNGEKMSKSRGTFIKASTYSRHLDPAYLRYYYACKLNSSQEDIDLNFDDFISRVNSDLIGKITNLASRGAQMLTKKLDGVIGSMSAKGAELISRAQSETETIAAAYYNLDYNKVILKVRSLAEEGNRYFDEMKPWQLIKTDQQAAREVLSTVLNLFRIMAVYLKPILPEFVSRTEQLFNEKPYNWQSSREVLQDHKINSYRHLITRIEKNTIDKIISDSVENDTDAKTAADTETYEKEAAVITIDDFFKIDLRVARITAAEEIKEANKLLRLEVDLGYEKRRLIAGLKKAYRPGDLIGRLTIVAANLKPRKMKFGVSQGMILAAGAGGSDLFILSPDSGAKPGQRIS